jgi:hypothetical protein
VIRNFPEPGFVGLSLTTLAGRDVFRRLEEIGGAKPISGGEFGYLDCPPRYDEARRRQTGCAMRQSE